MGKIFLVSNRLPFNVSIENGKVSLQYAVGGLSNSLNSFYQSKNAVWIGWPGISSEKALGYESQIKDILKQKNCVPVFLSENEIEQYYENFCNKTIWPSFNYFTQYTKYDNVSWKFYSMVNERFAKELAEEIQDDDLVWIHDYHLMLLPQRLRQKIAGCSIGFFLHTPFPSFEIFRMLPWRDEILDGILGADLIGFHTYQYVKHFLDSLMQLKGYDHDIGRIIHENRAIDIDCFPLGINFSKFFESQKNNEVAAEIKKLKQKIGNTRIILSACRLDYTKAVPNRIISFENFLEKNPEYHGKISLVLIAVPSRSRVEQYAHLKKEVDELVGKTNGKFGTIDWIPVHYFYRLFSQEQLSALYNNSEILLATPFRDGMNLVAKEFVAAKSDGNAVLILSELAGAASELSEATLINPNNIKEISNSIKSGLEMPLTERKNRFKKMQERLKRYTVTKWADDFINHISEIKKIQNDLSAKLLEKDSMEKMLQSFKKGKNRLILLDYDGTLEDFNENPNQAIPSEDLLKTIKLIAGLPGTKVAIVSGRKKEELDKWFSNCGVSLIAEHGLWLKESAGDWKMQFSLKADWKEKIKPVLETFVDRCPDSFVEEKDYSIAWHYRKCDPDLAKIRATELKEILINLTSNMDVGVLEGSKVLEIKNFSINKGNAVINFLKENFDFTLAIGDDLTDEDMFKALPPTAFSIKVGLSSSKAKYTVRSVNDVQNLLEKFAKAGIFGLVF